MLESKIYSILAAIQDAGQTNRYVVAGFTFGAFFVYRDNKPYFKSPGTMHRECVCVCVCVWGGGYSVI